MVKCTWEPSIIKFQKEVFFDTNIDDILYSGTEKGNDFYYAECDRTTNSSSTVCTVTVETPAAHDAVIKKSCNVTVSNWKTGDHVHQKMLVPLNHKSVFLVKEGKESLSSAWVFELLRMSDWNVIEVLFRPPDYVTILIEKTNHQDSISILYSSYNLEGSDLDCEINFCKVSYKFDGEKVHEPTEYLKLSQNFFPTLETAQLPMTLNDSTIIMTASKLIGNETELSSAYQVQNRSAIEFFTTNATFICLSTSHSKVSFCLQNQTTHTSMWIADSTIRSLLININLKLSDYSDSWIRSNVFRTYNLRDGGFIIFITERFHSNKLRKEQQFFSRDSTN